MHFIYRVVKTKLPQLFPITWLSVLKFRLEGAFKCICRFGKSFVRLSRKPWMQGYLLTLRATPRRRSQFGADVGEIKSACRSFPHRMEAVVEVIRTKLAWLRRILNSVSFFFPWAQDSHNNEAHLCGKLLSHCFKTPIPRALCTCCRHEL